MGVLNGMNDPDREARARMEAAERVSERKYSAKATATDATGKPLPARPMRYKLYDKIAKRVSVSAMNVIIGVVSLLLILAIVIGIATGTR